MTSEKTSDEARWIPSPRVGMPLGRMILRAAFVGGLPPLIVFFLISPILLLPILVGAGALVGIASALLGRMFKTEFVADCVGCFNGCGLGMLALMACLGISARIAPPDLARDPDAGEMGIFGIAIAYAPFIVAGLLGTKLGWNAKAAKEDGQ